MPTIIAPPLRTVSSSRFPSVFLATAVLTCVFLCTINITAQSPTHPAAAKSTPHKPRAHQTPKKQEPAPVAQTPPPPPMPDWPINDKPNPASIVWNATGLRINASNSSLQQILSEVSTETGTKVEGLSSDERVYGEYGPGKARDVLSELLHGSGYNVLLAGDLGGGTPRQIVLSPRLAGTGAAPNAAMNRPQQDNSDEDVPEQPEDQPPIQAPQLQNTVRPGPSFGPGGPIRTPQQVMEEMQQRQILQQQQQQQEQQQQNPPQ